MKMTKTPDQKSMLKKRSFLSEGLLTPEAMKNHVPQTLGETVFDFVSFIAGAQKADIRAKCSFRHIGLTKGFRHAARGSIQRTW